MKRKLIISIIFKRSNVTPFMQFHINKIKFSQFSVNFIPHNNNDYISIIRTKETVLIYAMQINDQALDSVCKY